ncbi:hypothetical protein SSAG_00262 [Streptomyces sp. Mg1]|nr:hypothetical protein SSAG_00262 [Streptomyces sp. Mg1]
MDCCRNTCGWTLDPPVHAVAPPVAGGREARRGQGTLHWPALRENPRFIENCTVEGTVKLRVRPASLGKLGLRNRVEAAVATYEAGLTGRDG